MLSSGFDHLNFTVKNLSDSTSFYESIFEFRVVERGVSDGVQFAILRLCDSLLCLYENPKRIFLDRFQLRKNNLHGLNHFSFRIKNHDEFLKRLQAHGVVIKYDGAVHYPHSHSYYFEDPTGYEIEAVVWNEDTIRFDSENV